MKTLINESIEDLQEALKNNPDLQEKFRSSPVEAIKNVEIKNPKETDYCDYAWIGYYSHYCRAHPSFLLE